MLSMLNDDCIHKILEWLPLLTLVPCSRTCKRLQTLCSYQFKRKYQKETSRPVEIEISHSGNVRIILKPDPYMSYFIKYFDNFIDNLRISFVYTRSKWCEKNLINFVRAKCDPKLHKITIAGLSGIETVNVTSSVLTSIIADFIRIMREACHVSALAECFSNLTTLSLTNLRSDDMTDAFLGQKFPKLKNLILKFGFSYNPPELKSIKVKEFLEKHSQLQYIEVNENDFKSYKSNEQSALAKLVCFRNVVHYSPNLEHFFLDIDEVMCKYGKFIFRYLQTLCDRSNFNVLELKCTPDFFTAHTNRLTNFKQLKKMHLTGIFYESNDYVRSISFDYSSLPLFAGNSKMQWSTVEELACFMDETTFTVPLQIGKFTLRVLRDSGDRKVWSYLMLFARHWKASHH